MTEEDVLKLKSLGVIVNCKAFKNCFGMKKGKIIIFDEGVSNGCH